MRLVSAVYWPMSFDRATAACRAILRGSGLTIAARAWCQICREQQQRRADHQRGQRNVQLDRAELRGTIVKRVKHVGERRDEQSAAVDGKRRSCQAPYKAAPPRSPSPTLIWPLVRPSSVKTGWTIIGAASRCSQKATSERRVSRARSDESHHMAKQEHADPEQQDKAEDDVLRLVGFLRLAKQRAIATNRRPPRRACRDRDRDLEAAPVQPRGGGRDRCADGRRDPAKRAVVAVDIGPGPMTPIRAKSEVAKTPPTKASSRQNGGERHAPLPGEIERQAPGRRGNPERGEERWASSPRR